MKEDVNVKLDAAMRAEQRLRFLITVFLALAVFLLLWHTLSPRHFLAFAAWFWQRVVVAGSVYVWNSFIVYYFGISAW